VFIALFVLRFLQKDFTAKVGDEGGRHYERSVAISF